MAALTLQGQELLLRTCLLASLALVVLWGLWLALARPSGNLRVSVAIHKHHWVQAGAQIAVFAYWGWYVRGVYAFAPLILAQLLFAYAVEALLSLSRRRRYTYGFGPFPVVLSINLFLWFRPEWFHWQFVMIALGYLGKELFRWQRAGRFVHIFNPSSFPLAVFALVLIVMNASDATFGSFIANSQHDPPLIYLVIFLAALPGQVLFGVARMTLSAVVTMYVFSLIYFQITGTYFFYDAHIPVPVFLGMHLLFTDPSTSPRSGLGRIGFGMLYAFGSVAFYVLLSGSGIPTFYDKLLPVPLMNLTVRLIDRLASTQPWAALDPARLAPRLAGVARNAAWTGVWTVVFLGMSAFQGVGDRHPGQYLPFWLETCGEGSARACAYASFLTVTYCNNGSGWACNEVGVQLARAGEGGADQAFQRACEIGFQPGCANAGLGLGRPNGTAPARADPGLADLPIVLRGTKPALVGLSPEQLRALACEQRWPRACAPRSSPS